MARLLIVHHTPSPAVHSLFLAARDGASDPALAGVEVRSRAALVCPVPDALESDGYLLITPANIGYMSGALKHFFDQAYYPCLEQTIGRPYGLIVHGSSDVGGAVRAVETVASGLRWKRAAVPVTVVGTPGPSALEASRELGARVSALVMTG